MFLILHPFFHSRCATGKAPYKGPACRVANRITMIIPFIPEYSPICFVIASFGTQTSNKPIRMNNNGRNKSISLKKFQKLFSAISITGLKLTINEKRTQSPNRTIMIRSNKCSFINLFTDVTQRWVWMPTETVVMISGV